MPPTSHGRMPPQTRDALAAGNNGPPPSTLAAQLVESISVSARSTRPDETSELSKLLGVIEKVKNQPGLLQTQQDRVDHNHMLIYVYTRVSLEGIKWDDPFADRQELCSDALGAINFLKFAIRETPEVLLTSSNDGSLLFRGQEPLWVWLFPKILKTLGSNLSSDLVEAVSDFFGELLLASCQTSALWPLIPQFLSYLQLNVQGKPRRKPTRGRQKAAWQARR